MKYVSLSDFSIFFIKPCFSKMASSPTKLGELMSAEIPVITNSGVGDVESIVTTVQGGIIVNDFTEKNYSNAVEEMLNFKKDSTKMRSLSSEMFHLNKALENYNNIYQSILKEKQ
jgi:hypothetical protein